jgi:hypothetical protein
MMTLFILGFYLAFYAVGAAAAAIASAIYPARETGAWWKWVSVYVAVFVPIAAWLVWAVIIASPIVRSL